MHPALQWVNVSAAHGTLRHRVDTAAKRGECFVMVGTSVALPLPFKGRGPG